MSSKEVKNLLKEAREAIKIKEFPVAIRKCKVICELINFVGNFKCIGLFRKH